MPRFAVPYAKLSSALILLAAAGSVSAQTDDRDRLIEDLRRRIEALEKQPLPVLPAPPPAPQGDEGLRALERTLVREGGLVLPPGVLELEPRLQYTYRGADALRIVQLDGITQVAQQDLARNELEASLGLRLGLRSATQFELRVPYTWLRENRATAGTRSDTESVSGAGDVEFGLAKQLLSERRSRPNLLASVNWKTASAEHRLGRLSPGTGFHHVQGALTAVKREDPLVFFGALSYIARLKRSFDGRDIDPGDALGFKGGALLAASPETSLRGGFELTGFRRTKLDGSAVPGSDATTAFLEVGLATLLSPKALLDIQLAVGLTADSPDFRLRFAVPIRF